jgi:hypothetical protein
MSWMSWNNADIERFFIAVLSITAVGGCCDGCTFSERSSFRARCGDSWRTLTQTTLVTKVRQENESCSNVGTERAQLVQHNTLYDTRSDILMKTKTSILNSNVKFVDCIWNVMAHAQKPDFVFRRNGRVHLNRRGRQFSRLLTAEVYGSAVVMLDTPCSEVVWRVLDTNSIRQFPLHFPSRVSHLNWTLLLYVSDSPHKLQTFRVSVHLPTWTFTLCKP